MITDTQDAMQADLRRLDHQSSATQKILRPVIHKLPRLNEVLKSLPEIKQVDARKYLVALSEVLTSLQIRRDPDDPRLVRIEEDILYTLQPAAGLVLTRANASDIVFKDDRGTPHVTPRGGNIIASLYSAHKLPMNPGSAVASTNQMLAMFPNEADLITMARVSQSAAQIAAERRRAMISDPSLLTENDFEYSLLSDIFIKRFGLSRHSLSMEIGGISVMKLVTVFRSNSGKNHDSTVQFSWISGDGTQQTIEKDSRYAGNRRSDPERNWGLPE